MKGNGFTFAVRVRCKVNGIGITGCFFQLLNNFGFAFNVNILWFKIVLNLYSEIFWGQIFDMAGSGRNIILCSKVFFKCFNFGGGLDN